MINFTRRITVQNGFDAEFTFKRVFTLMGIRYYVFAIDRQGETVTFIMGQSRDKWKIVNPEELPAWAKEKEIESEISAAIVQEGCGEDRTHG
jgi:hypothetical protein